MMHSPRVALVCPSCETRVEKRPDEIAAAIRRHNVDRHDGQPVAHVAGGHVDRLRGDRA